ncbi:MAG TPA: SAM-dependent methyltransferase [Candidatus Sulfotelmatobacter sp.]|jgi:SAM-dependent MidA family methyltransferase|nr:SAM-dependent methyltransferase [Candidatus Sulfotelmatobacter sp.]
MVSRSEPTPLALILAERIRSRGPITFAAYMEACLYHPLYGYYTTAEQQPRRDYFTSVDASPLFGRLLARQFQQMWCVTGRQDGFCLVEAGAGTGRLAKQILDFTAETFPEFYEALRFIAVERSAARRAAQSKLVEPHVAQGKFTSQAELGDKITCGCIFSNELIDAMPVHRLTREGNELWEMYVGLGKNGFCDEMGPLSSAALGEYLLEQNIHLNEGQQAEVNLAACRWIEEAAQRLERGFVVTIDYGHDAKELYDQRHMRGTLLAYERHRASEDWFRAPGEQDLTAHVNFTALDSHGRRNGLVRTGLTSQSNFLLLLARHGNFADLQSEEMSEAEQTQRRLLFKTLINPEGMGETFQVLIQHKGIDPGNLAALQPL